MLNWRERKNQFERESEMDGGSRDEDDGIDILLEFHQ